MVRRVLRWTMRGVKAVLALIALAAVAVWPWSYGHPGVIEASRWTFESDRAEWVDAEAIGIEGRVGMSGERFIYRGTAVAPARGLAAGEPAGWWWRTHAVTPREALACSRKSGCPVGWDSLATDEPRFVARSGSLSLPCWLLASITAAWPLASGLLWVRRRRRARRGAAAGRCRHCGYDLRATPSPGGTLLGRCPECGRPSENSAAAERSIPT